MKDESLLNTLVGLRVISNALSNPVTHDDQYDPLRFGIVSQIILAKMSAKSEHPAMSKRIAFRKCSFRSFSLFVYCVELFG